MTRWGPIAAGAAALFALVGCGGSKPQPAPVQDARSAAHVPKEAPADFLAKPLKEMGPGSKHSNVKPAVK
jgi:hypothetical protein